MMRNHAPEPVASTADHFETVKGKNASMAEPKSFDIARLAKEADQAYWTALRITKSAALAEEAVQDAFAALLRRTPEYLGEEQMRHCFFLAVRRSALFLMRKEKRRRRHHHNFRVEPQVQPDGNPAETFQDTELARAARAAMDSLPLEEREAVGLCYEQGLSQQAVAKILGLPKQTVSHRVNRGLEKLRRILTTQGFAVAAPTAPVLIGQALGALPLPSVPAGLTAKLSQLAANPSLAAQYASAASAKSLTATGTSKLSALSVWITAAVVGLGVAGTFYLVNESQNQKSTSTAGGSEASQNSRDKHAYLHWTFEDGIPPEMSALQGVSWRPGKDGLPGAAVCEPIKQMLLLLPSVVLSERPHVLTAKFRLLKKEPWGFGAWATEGIVVPEVKFWRISQTLFVERQHEISHYYLGRHRFVVLNEEVVRVEELTGAAVNERNLYLSLENVALEDLVFRSLEAREVPERLRDPEALIAKMNIKLDQKEGGAPLFHVRKDGKEEKSDSFYFSFDKGIPQELKKVPGLSGLQWVPGKDGYPGGVIIDTRKQPYFLMPFVMPEKGFILRTKYRILDKNNWTFRLVIGQGLYSPDLRFWLKFKEKSGTRSNLDYYFYGRYGVTVSEGQVVRIELRDEDLRMPRLFLGPANVVLEEFEVIGKDPADFPPELEPEALIKKMGVVLDNKTEGYLIMGRFPY